MYAVWILAVRIASRCLIFNFYRLSLTLDYEEYGTVAVIIVLGLQYWTTFPNNCGNSKVVGFCRMYFGPAQVSQEENPSCHWISLPIGFLLAICIHDCLMWNDSRPD